MYDGWGQYAKAAEYYEKSLEIARKIGDVKREGKTLNNLGVLYRTGANIPRQWSFKRSLWTIKRKTGDLDGEGDSLKNLGNVYSTGANIQGSGVLREVSGDIQEDWGREGRRDFTGQPGDVY